MDQGDPEALFKQTVSEAYESTRRTFALRSKDLNKYVVPKSTAPKVGFAIFYTPPVFRPALLIIGQNPANFAGPNLPYTDAPNKEMLSGRPPTVNSYLEHKHEFAVTLREFFQNYQHRLVEAVGMNFWHYQKPANEDELPPSSLLTECENISRKLIEAIEPSAILCFHARARDVLRRRGASKLWYVPHPTGGRTRVRSKANISQTLAEIDAYLKSIGR